MAFTPESPRHRASKPQGSSERVLPWQITMDQLIFASLSHTHYWYEVGMLKVPAVVLFPVRSSCFFLFCTVESFRTTETALKGKKYRLSDSINTISSFRQALLDAFKTLLYKTPRCVLPAYYCGFHMILVAYLVRDKPAKRETRSRG